MDLNYERKNIYKNCSKQDLQNIFDFCEGYKDFLNKGKTEREACAYAVKLCEENGYKPFTFAEKLKVGDKRYFLNRDKSIFIVKIGTEDIEKEGVKIMAAHVDSPRLDLKPNPLYEDAEIRIIALSSSDRPADIITSSGIGTGYDVPSSGDVDSGGWQT